MCVSILEGEEWIGVCLRRFGLDMSEAWEHGNSGDWCLSASIWIRYERSMGTVVIGVCLRRFGLDMSEAWEHGKSGDWCLSASIWIRYERSMRNLFVLTWARVLQVAL